ncbi:uncharacterized protein LOC129775590 isoform X2 [Toxorhynchites rutilus septentrionalis]|uniref:uncharacterized protein LOC129775590 isoform X2 n=1 Tax=Toxorhynchites rutilus septentrionalis TaxID=329112 RepID=UPI0024797774|nr:uncharacterized protein LOC129775590 isoform X2 [Toxorhynchites rutilus septentrionalis]
MSSNADETDRSAVTNGNQQQNNVTVPTESQTTAPTIQETSLSTINSLSGSSDKATNWVKFDEEDGSKKPTEAPGTTPAKITQDKVSPAVLPTESVHISVDLRTSNTPKHNNQANTNTSPAVIHSASTITKTSQPAVIDIPKQSVNVVQPIQSMRTIELSTGRVREGFANGDVIVTLLPTNTRWPWITPAVFRPELVPEELMAQGLTLTVEEYVHAMETLVNDYRFTMYNICYKRVLVLWILFAFIVLLGLLFSGLYGITLFSLGVGWLFLNAAAIFLCMWVKLRLARGLERCMARVNKQLIRHKILLALDDRGHISCHKVNLCFLYFEPSQCISYLNEFIERSEQNGNTIEPGWESRLDVSTNDIVIQGANTTRLSRKQERGFLLLLRYASRWGNESMRGLIDVTSLQPARHCRQFQCPCQYIEFHLKCKPRGKCKFCNFLHWVTASEQYG